MTTSPTFRQRSGLVRSAEDRILAGVAGGLGRAHGIDPILIRSAFGILLLAGGSGVILYLALALAMEPPRPGVPVSRPVRTDLRTVAGVASLTGGVLILFRTFGLWFGDGFVWPLALVTAGASVMWTKRADSRAEGPSAWRMGLGALVVLAGLLTFVATNVSVYALPSLVVPFAAVLAGTTIVFGPWLARTWNQLAAERRERIRSEERSALAAHLHDSVLQTLALIQRSDSPTRMSSLARVQERELRAWLYGRSDSLAGEYLSTAVDASAGRIEEMHEVSVEVVTVGDAVIDEPLAALIAACGEAMHNAARHSGTGEISVYVEVEPDRVSAFVRDQGKGFDPRAVPPDRRGIADSIVGRVERHGGSATITSAPARGTEVAISVPRGRRP